MEESSEDVPEVAVLSFIQFRAWKTLIESGQVYLAVKNQHITGIS